MKKILVALLVASFAISGCKNEKKKEVEIKKEVTADNMQEASFKISGMTCAVGCAKTIQSKLASKEGVVDAKVVFADSLATVKFDKTKTTKEDLMKFVNGMADGKTYKSCDGKKKECSKKKDDKSVSCSSNCNKECNKDGKACDVACKKECSKDKEQKASATDCKKECCAKA